MPVVLGDAGTYVSVLPRGCVRCAVLDAYDARGRVPTHLQEEPFVRALGAALAPGGHIIANLWYGTPAGRAEAVLRCKLRSLCIGVIAPFQGYCCHISCL